jgi:hypothetical protein
MRSSGGSVGIAGTTEHAKTVVGEGCAIQGEVGRRVAHRLRGEAVEEMCGGVQGLGLVAGMERLLEEKVADHVGGGVNDAFGPAIMGSGVGARETELDAMSEEEGVRGVVVELVAIITLEGMDQRRNWIETQMKKWVRVANVSNFNRSGKVQKNEKNHPDEVPEQPWTWTWKKEDESGGRAGRHGRGAQRNPDYKRYRSG